MAGESLGLMKIICPRTEKYQGHKVGVDGLGSRAVGGYKGLLG